MEDTKAIYERMQKYISKTNIPSRYDMEYNELRAILTEAVKPFDVVSLAFQFGFEKGCRCTRKAATVNV